MVRFFTRWLENAMGRLFEGPQPVIPELKPLTPTPQPEHIDIEQIISETMARWYGDEFDRRPLTRVLADAVRPYLRTPAGHATRPAADLTVRERFDQESG